jgi:hypothetical protein
MKICKNKGKTTIVASRQGNMWHFRNGGDGKVNASKARLFRYKARQVDTDVNDGAQGVDGLRSAVLPHCSAVVAAAVDTVSYTAAALRCVAGPAAAATGALRRWPPFRGPVSPCSP